MVDLVEVAIVRDHLLVLIDTNLAMIVRPEMSTIPPVLAIGMIDAVQALQQ